MNILQLFWELFIGLLNFTNWLWTWLGSTVNFVVGTDNYSFSVWGLLIGGSATVFGGLMLLGLIKTFVPLS
jgi:hypothetical protein